MSYSDGKISGAVSVYDVQRALGVSSDDVATLCTSNKINKWAKYKPVHCANSERKFGRLIEHDYEVQNINAGQYSGKTTYYGLQIVTKPAVLNITIHDNDYLYVGGPVGTESSPYRLQDFTGPSGVAYGYDINAVPNIYGDEFREKPTGNQLPIFARVNYKGNNPTGINLFAMTGNGYAGDTSSFVPNTFYVGVMKSLIVNGTIQSSSWRVLYRSNDPNITEVPPGETPSPLDDSSTPLDPSYEGHLEHPFSHYFYTDVPANSTGDYKITFFIISVADINTYYPGAKSVWQKYEGETLHHTNPIPIPGLIGRNLTIGSHDHGYDVTLDPVTINPDTFIVSAMGSSMAHDERGTYTAILTMPRISNIPNGTIGTWTSRVPHTFNVTWQLPVVSLSGTYTYTITIKLSPSSGGGTFDVGTKSGEWNFD